MDAPPSETSSFEPDDETRRRTAHNYGGKDMMKTPIHHGHRRTGGGVGGGRSSSNCDSINRKSPKRESESLTDTEAYCSPKNRQSRSVKGIPARSRSDDSLALTRKTSRGSSTSSREYGLPGIPSSPKNSSLKQRLEAGSKSAAAAAARSGDGDACEVKSVMSVQRRRRHHHPLFKMRNNDNTDQSVSTVRTDIEHVRRRHGSRREQSHGLHSQVANGGGGGGRSRQPTVTRPRHRHRPEGNGTSSTGRVPVGDDTNEDPGRSGIVRFPESRHRPSSPDRTTSSNQHQQEIRPRSRSRGRRSQEEQTPSNQQHDRPRSRSRGRSSQEEQTSSKQRQHERPRSQSRGRLPQEEQTSSNQQHGRPRSRSRGRRSQEEQGSSKQQHQHERPRNRSRGRLPQEEQTSSNQQHDRPRSRSRGRRSQEEQGSSNQQQDERRSKEEQFSSNQQHERPRNGGRGRRSQEEQMSSNQQQHERPRSKSRGRRSQEEQTSTDRQQHERQRSKSRGRSSREEQQNQTLDNAPKSPVRKGSVDHRIPYKSPRQDLQNDESQKPRRTQPASPKRCFRARVTPNGSPNRTPTSEKSSPCTPPEHSPITSIGHVPYLEDASPSPRTSVEDSKLIFKSSKSNSTELSSLNESSLDKEGSDNSFDVDDDATDDGTVLQFDPTQTNNVYRVQQVSNAGSSYQVKNSDGTSSTVQIAEIVDRKEEGILTKEESPIFDFLEDQDTCPPEAGIQAPRMPNRRLSTEPPPSPDRADCTTAQEGDVEQAAQEGDVEQGPQPQQRCESRSEPKTHTGPRNPDQSGSGLRKKRPSGPDRQSSTTDESQECTSHIVSSGRRRPAPGKTSSENSATRTDPHHVAMKNSPRNGDTTEQQTDTAVTGSNSRRIVGDAKNYSQFFSSITRTPPHSRDVAGPGGLNDSWTSLGTDGYSAGCSVSADGVVAMNPPSLTEDELDSPPVRTRRRMKTKKKKPQHGPHGTPVVRKPRTFATRDNIERSPNSESEFSDVQSPRERRMRVKRPPITPAERGERESDRQTTARSQTEARPWSNTHTEVNDRDLVANEPQTPGGKVQAPPPAASDCEGVEDTPVTAKNKKRISMGLASSIGRYFSNGRSRRSSPGTDVESSGWESEGSGSVLSTSGSRLFARNKVIQHQLLGDDSSSYESSLGSCGTGKIRT